MGEPYFRKRETVPFFQAGRFRMRVREGRIFPAAMEKGQEINGAGQEPEPLPP